jgi:hypothetical protein
MAMRHAMKDRFVMISRWQLDCGIELAWQHICAIRHWPNWWPKVSAVHAGDTRCNEDGFTPRVGSNAQIDWKTRLGYGLRLRVTTTRVKAPFELEGAAEGDLRGRGLWVLEPLGRGEGDNHGGVRITYRWDVYLNRRWMRLAAPLLRPVFAWNHFSIMRSGADGMARSIGCRLLRYQDYQFSPGEASEDLRELPWPEPFALPSSRELPLN